MGKKILRYQLAYNDHGMQISSPKRNKPREEPSAAHVTKIQAAPPSI
jgi:hypothetical protein